MIGQSDCFRRIVALVSRFATCDAPVLIEGETGTGKEVAARAVHYQSSRRGRPFVPVNCGALPDTLIENELFGHRQGAYTDAHGDIPGLVELAHGGTLFFDEVDALTSRAQVILLRFLQDHRYRPLGGRREETADVRIITASNRALNELVEQGQFRADLLFRINILNMELPSLRQRLGDIELLAQRFVADCAQRYQGTHKALTPEALAWLVSYSWPGNIRELENRIHRGYLLSDDATLDLKDVAIAAVAEESLAAVSYVDARSRALDAFHRQYLTSLLRRAQGNVTQAAREAGKERRALGKLVKKYGIDVGELRQR
ncbi:MAG: Fis family transcriptional regulator [Betaproteobacteria bacterium]|nr:Fis family transcriptional regulator [Betaproteobacteria bacterium]